MTISVFNLFSIGIGPSSSHTVGPMRAAASFTAELCQMGLVQYVDQLRIAVYGSLAATGDGHGTFTAILLGLEGLHPETVEVEQMDAVLARQRDTGRVRLAGQLSVALTAEDLIRLPAQTLDFHPNAMEFTAIGGGSELLHHTYYSVGGGFIVTDGETTDTTSETAGASPYTFSTAAELLALNEAHQLPI